MFAANAYLSSFCSPDSQVLNVQLSPKSSDVATGFFLYFAVSDELRVLRKREAEQNIEADWEIDAFMTADTVKGKREAIVSEYILRILGLDVSFHIAILLSYMFFITLHNCWCETRNSTSCIMLLMRSAMLDICTCSRARLAECYL